MSEVRGQTTIQYVKQGDTLNTQLRSTFPLKQFITAVTGQVSPHFNTNLPCIYPVIRSSLRATRVAAIISDVHWYYNGAEITFGQNGLSTMIGGVSDNGTFKSEVKTVDGFQVPTLTILKDLASPTNIDSDTIEFRSKANTGFEGTVSAAIEVSIEQTEGEAYVGYATLGNGGTIDADHQSIQAAAHLLVGGVEKTQADGVTFAWYKMRVAVGVDGWERVKVNNVNVTAATLTIGKNDINSSELYKCVMTYQERSAEYVFDVSDETDMLVAYLNPVDANNQSVAEYVSSTQQLIIYKPKVLRRDSQQEVSGYVFNFLLTDAAGNEIASADNASQFTVTLAHAQQAQGNLGLIVSGDKTND